jgi:hypothetical protein
MNTQTKLTELDATKLANLRLRQQLLTNEAQQFERDLFLAYGNPDEDIAIGADNSVTRTPRQPEVKPKGKGARKPGNR